jgi:hypothetical protein
MTGADKYAEVCREGAVLGTGGRRLLVTRTDARDGLVPSQAEIRCGSHSDLPVPT